VDSYRFKENDTIIDADTDLPALWHATGIHMSILIRCKCGKELKVKDELAGRRAKCPECGDIFTVPDSSDRVPSREAVSKNKPPPLRPPSAETTVDDHPDEEEDERSRRRRRRDEDDYADEEDDERPRRRRRHQGEVDEDDYADEEEDERPRRRRRREDEIDDEDEERATRQGRRSRRERRRGRRGSDSRLSRRDVYSVAIYQKVLLLCILGQISLAILSGVVGPVGLKLVLILAVLATGLVATVFVFMLAIKAYSAGVGVVLAILTFIPVVGLIILLIINGKATSILKEHGYKVGFLGASLSQFH
jgi:hypothetical protein